MKILMVGLGGAGQRLMRILSEILGKEVQFIAYRKKNRPHVINPDFSLSGSDNVEQKYSVKSFDNLERALSEKPTAAIIANPTSEHVNVALEIAKAGCHLFIEKPLSHTLDQIDELEDIVRTQKLVALVGYQFRFHPAFQKISELMEQEALGDILFAKLSVGSFLPSWHPYEDFRSLYAAQKKMGGGVLLTESHEIDLVYWLFKMPVQAFAVGGTLGHYDIDVEDTASVTLQQVDAKGRHFPVHIQMCFVERPASRSCEIQGTKGKLIFNHESKTLRVYYVEPDRSETFVFDQFERIQMFEAEMRHFLDCIKKNKTPLIGLQDAKNSLKITLAAKQSISRGQAISL